METNEDYRAVLWVRHCFGCHNKVKFKATNPLSYAKFIPYTSSEQQAYKVASYCTAELGEIQSLIFGYRLKNIISKFNITENIGESINKMISNMKEQAVKEEETELESAVALRAKINKQLDALEALKKEEAMEGEEGYEDDYVEALEKEKAKALEEEEARKAKALEKEEAKALEEEEAKALEKEENAKLEKKGILQISLYSSVLPRAMETAKLISKGTIITNLSNKDDEIKRINFIQEKIEKNGDLVNSTTLNNSNEAVDILNSEFTKGRGYCLISKNIPIAATEEETEFKTQDKEEIKNNYKAFKSKVLKDLPYDKLNLIVSHSSFLKHALDFDEDKKMENLDAYLIIYKKIGETEEGPLWEEIPKLRRLYLFVENKIIEPDKDGNLNPPIRNNRKKDIKKNHELIKSVGLALLPGYLPHYKDDETEKNRKMYESSCPKKCQIKKLIYKTLGECKNEEIKKLKPEEVENICETDQLPDTLFCEETSSNAIMNRLEGGYKRTKKNKKSKKKKSKNKKSKKKKSKKKKSKKRKSKKKKY